MSRAKLSIQLHPRVPGPRVSKQKCNLLFRAALFVIDLLLGELSGVGRKVSLFAVLYLTPFGFSRILKALSLILCLPT